MADPRDPPDASYAVSEVVKRLNEDGRRIRNVEMRVEKIDASINSLEETVLNQLNDLKIDLEKLGNKIGAVADRLSAMENEILRLTKEQGKAVTKAELKNIETYVDILNPITSRFVTKDELDRALDERLRKKA